MNNQYVKDTHELDLGHVFAVVGVVEWYVNNYVERWTEGVKHNGENNDTTEVQNKGILV
jgi:hypothetical protein